LLQLCDFGVAATLESRVSKRTTIIGTPHYMPLELVSRLGKDDPAEINKFNYGTEVDIWSYGIAVYEMATGQPPNAMTRINHLPDVLERAPPRLEGGDFSDELREFIAFCLEEDPNDRPSAETLLEHEYIASSARTHPTHKLAKLVTRFVSWEHRGGQRASLFVGGGAEFPEPLSSAKPDPDWNFSTTEEFDMQFEDVTANFDRLGENGPGYTNGDTDSVTPRANQRRMPPWEKAKTEERIRRGQRDLGKLFDPDPDASPYKYRDAGRRSSDLPLRNFSNEAGDRTTMIDLDDIDGPGLPTIDLGSIPTYRGNRTNRWSDASEEEGTYQPKRYSKRMTREWTFPVAEAPVENLNRRTQDWTFPKMDAGAISDDTGARRQQTSRRVPSLRVDEATVRNRKTQDWTFPVMETINSASPHQPLISLTTAPNDIMSPRGRPQLKHAATTGDLSDFFPSLSNHLAHSPERGSMIDLDFADLPVYGEIPRPSTAVSATSEATIGDPFDLDQLTTRKSSEEDVQDANNRHSMHMKAKSESSAQIEKNAQKKYDDREYGSDHGPSLLNKRSSSQASKRSSNRTLRQHHPSARLKQSALQRRWEDTQPDMFSDAEYDASDNMSDIDSVERLNGAAAHGQFHGNGGGSISSSNSGFQFPDFNNMPSNGSSGSHRPESRLFPSAGHHPHHQRHFHRSTDDSRTLGSFADSDSLVDYYPHHQRPAVEVAESDPFDPRVLRMRAPKDHRFLDAERFLRDMRGSIASAMSSFSAAEEPADEQVSSAGGRQGSWEGTWPTPPTAVVMGANGNGYSMTHGSVGVGM